MPRAIPVAVVTNEHGTHLDNFLPSLAAIEEVDSVALVDPSGANEQAARKALGKKLREVHKTLRDATTALKKSKMLSEAFGQGVIDHYVHTAEWEQFEYDRRVTDWELKRGFERS